MKRAIHLLFPPVAAVVLLIAGRPVEAQKKIDIPAPDPELERRSFEVADGFEVNLFAADPQLTKPIQMNFDAAGRLWVACSELYPQIAPGQVADDKIIVLEDTKGVGKADKVTVFASGLMIPTGIEPGDGGAYVANSTEIIHLRDTDGDGKADARRVVLSGFGTEDTHHIIHTFRWGPDGMMYFNQSVYIHSHVETPHGVRRLGAGGIWQFRPETVRLEVFLHGFVNTWGHHFDAWGQSFVTDGAGGEGINHAVVGAAYMWAPGVARRLFGLNPGSPKYCGLEVLGGTHLPEAWRGNLLTNDFRAHRVCRFVLQDDGPGFTARLMPDLIRTNHAGFRPVDIKMGPDGAIYIADWYNPIIQHGEVDFRDPRRDRTHGRIWRVTAKGRPVVPRPRLVGEPVEKLLEALKSPEDWTRHFAKRVLKERGAREVVPALAAWVGRLDPNEPQYEHHRLEALWTYQSLDVPEPALLRSVLAAKDYRARAAAARVIPHWQPALTDAVALAGAAAADEHPRVRLEGLRALARIPDERSMPAALAVLDKPMHPLLDYALWLTARDLLPHWMPAVEAGKLDFGDPRKLSFALQAAGPAGVNRLMDMLRSGRIPPEQEGDVLALIAGSGGPAELAAVLDRALAPQSGANRAAVLIALTSAARERNVRPTGDPARVIRLIDDADPAVRAAAARAVGAWKLEPARPRLTALAGAPDTPAGLRRAAMDGLAALGGPASRATLDKLCQSDRPAAVRTSAVIALASLDLKGAVGRAVDVLAGLTPDDDPVPVFTALVQPRAGPALLAPALAGRKLPADVAKLGIRTVRAAGRDEAGLVDALVKAGGITSGPRTLTAEQMLKMVEAVKTRGDPARGEEIYRRRDLACLKCHAVAGSGGRVGPGLESIGASAQIDYLIESLLVPDKAIKEGFHSVAVKTVDDRVLTGVLVRKSDAQTVIRDAEDREVVIPAGNIDAVKQAGSIMPAGLIDNLTDPELVDLVRFLSELGKVGPYAVGRARVVRTWQALERTPESLELMRVGGPEAAVGDDKLVWAPVYSKVSGVLPAPAATGMRVRGSEMFAAVVRFRLEATTAGKVKLLLHSPAGLSMWSGRTPVEPAAEVVIDVPVGVHTVTLAYDPTKRTEPLRIELDDLPGSPARVQVVGGK